MKTLADFFRRLFSRSKQDDKFYAAFDSKPSDAGDEFRRRNDV